jgi:hypothetical protein
MKHDDATCSNYITTITTTACAAALRCTVYDVGRVRMCAYPVMRRSVAHLSSTLCALPCLRKLCVAHVSHVRTASQQIHRDSCPCPPPLPPAPVLLCLPCAECVRGRRPRACGAAWRGSRQWSSQWQWRVGMWRSGLECCVPERAQAQQPADTDTNRYDPESRAQS